MTRYVQTHPSARLARFAYRLHPACEHAFEYTNDADFECWHFESRHLTRREYVVEYLKQFRAGWLIAGTDGNPWFELKEPTAKPVALVDR